MGWDFVDNDDISKSIRPDDESDFVQARSSGLEQIAIEIYYISVVHSMMKNSSSDQNLIHRTILSINHHCNAFCFLVFQS
jgi:hypothetical protein